jgi:hypothetical protein
MVLPGMVVKADVITGQRSLLSYLLKPILRGFTQLQHRVFGTY